MRFAKYAPIFIALVVFIGCAAGGGRSRAVNVRVALLDVSAAGGESGGVEFLALRRIFDILGIPYDVLTAPSEMGDYKVVYSGGALTNLALSAEGVNRLYDYVERGGVLVSAGELGNKFYSLFGVEEHLPSRGRYRLSFVGKDVSLKYIDHPNERTISLGNGEKHLHDEVIWSHGYRLSGGAIPLALFDDGSVGFFVNSYGRGRAYLLGLTYTESVLLPQIGKDYEAQRKYVNSFEPSADVVVLLLKAIYEANVSPFVYLSTVPYAKPTALILSHDVDAQTSFVDSLKYADLEERYGVRSTFFENTKYFADWMDVGYYDGENVEAIRELKRRGWDIGSHTVSHYKKLSSAPEGDPNVAFASYDPAKQVTVQGEVKVSKELLDRDIPGQRTISFRAGDLQFPPMLIRVLEEAGYLYDSSFSANDVLTALPFRALRERNLGSSESNVMEIPVTLDDSMGYLTPETVSEVVKAWTEIAQANADNEAITVLLIHPSDTRTKTYKLEAQEVLMKKIVEVGGWMGDLTTFGEFWRERDALNFDAHIDGRGNLVIEVEGREADLNPMMGFVVGKGPEVRGVMVKDSGGSVLDYLSSERNGKLRLGRRVKPERGRK
ncbi:MAG: polysaccharide deacetylase family protein [bacterium]